jgi:D-alanyl-D-alanine carboxypeptidase
LTLAAYLLWALLALGLLGFSPPTLGSGDPFEPPVGSSQLAALASQQDLAVTAAAAVLMDGRTGHVLRSHNADARLAPASLKPFVLR